MRTTQWWSSCFYHAIYMINNCDWFTSTLLESGMPIRILVHLCRPYVFLPIESCRTPWSCQRVLPNVWWDPSFNCQNSISRYLNVLIVGHFYRTKVLRASLAHVKETTIKKQ